MTSRFLIYALTDPDGAVRYVGKSSSGLHRPKAHRAPSQLKPKTYRAAWIRSLFAQGQDYGIQSLEELPSGDGLSDAERRWIAHGRAAGWRLTNLTDGGDGTPGWKHSPETRALLSAQKKADAAAIGERARLANTGRKLSDEHKAKLRERRKDRVFTTETCERISSSLTGKPKPYMAERNRSQSMREKVAEGLRGVPKAASHRAAMSAARKGVRPSEEARAKMSASRRGLVQTEETKRKRAASMAAWRATPEGQQAMKKASASAAEKRRGKPLSADARANIVAASRRRYGAVIRINLLGAN